MLLLTMGGFTFVVEIEIEGKGDGMRYEESAWVDKLFGGIGGLRFGVPA